jgi:hypothetical protein
VVVALGVAVPEAVVEAGGFARAIDAIPFATLLAEETEPFLEGVLEVAGVDWTLVPLVGIE